MKYTGIFTTLLFVLLCFHLHARQAEPANITLTVKNASVEQVFKEIKKQSGYGFVYPSGILSWMHKVTFTATKASFRQVLDQLFKDQPFTYTVIDKVVVIKSKVNDSGPSDQPVTGNTPTQVSGKITNENDEPLQGVTVAVKGTDQVTYTDANGQFSISNIPRGATLHVSSVNMETFELKINGRTDLAIRMKEKVRELADVTVMVNTGYERIPKERATGSFEFIANEELERRAGTDILSRLEGVATGILFDKRRLASNQTSMPINNVTIRGLSTLTETMKRPLVVLNNFPYEGDINNINPNDIENITILKDAAAASIWGARAANGVIVINTKKARFDQATSLSFNGNVTIGEKPDLFRYPSMAIADVIENEIFLFGKGFYNTLINNTSTFPALTPTVEILANRRAGKISAADSASLIGELLTKDVKNDFAAYIYRPSVAHQYAVSLSGGSNLVKYVASMGYDKNLYNLEGNSYQRINFRTDITAKPIQQLDLNISILYTDINSTANSLGDFGSSAYDIRPGRALYPYAQLADEQGNPLSTPKNYRTGYVDTAGGGLLQDWHYKILEESRNTKNKTNNQDILLGLTAGYTFNDLISVTGSYQFEHTNIKGSKLMNQHTYYTRNLINLYTEIYPGRVVNNIPLGGILDEYNGQLRSHAGRLQVNIHKNWDTKHQVVSILGAEIRTKEQSQNAERVYGYNADNLSTSLVDYITHFPLYGGRGSATIPFTGGIMKSTDRFVSVFGNVSYTYNSKYILSVSARKDAANLFGVQTNNKWKPFWTAGASWNISNESFFNSNTFNTFRLRTSYGSQGNVNNLLTPYTILQYSPATENPLNNVPFASISVPGNPGLSWEMIYQFNAGMDFGLLSNRITGSVDVFRKHTDNLILRAEIDPTTGIASVFKNSASMIAKGIDISVNTVNIKNSHFRFATEFGLGYAINKVKNFLIDQEGMLVSDLLTGGGSTGIGIYPLKGKAPYSIFSLPFAGLNGTTGDPQGYIGKTVTTDYRAIFNQRADTAALHYNGSAIPTVFGFLNNSFQYKGISVLVNINYRLGYYFRKSTIDYYRLNNAGITHSDFAKRWQRPGDEAYTTIPSRVYPVSNNRRDNFYAYSTENAEKGDHVRLQFIKLGYEFKPSGKKVPIRSAQVYIIANNLGILWRANKEKLDPDYNPATSFFPPPRSITAGVKMNL